MVETFMNVHTASNAGIDPRHTDAATVAGQQAFERGDPATQAGVATLRPDARMGLTALGAERVRHLRLG